MRIFALSDIHIDYEENQRWILNLPLTDYKYDILILAGDISDILEDTELAFRELTRRFLHVFYIPGNHDLWIHRSDCITSIQKFEQLKHLAVNYGIHMSPLNFDQLSIVPLYGWFDYSFGMPSSDLFVRWADFTHCRWPEGFREQDITDYFIAFNTGALEVKNQFIISFSHFLPRPDLIPIFVPPSVKSLLPAMGTALLEKQIRKIQPNIHIYGHSHLNRRVIFDKIVYINNALGYPHETRITTRELLSVYEV